MEQPRAEAGHVVLLGDSIFDNGAYVPGEPDVIRQLRDALGDRWNATLLAVDGAVIADVEHQLRRLPEDTTWLVVSAGGNDALAAASLLRQPATSVGAALMELAQAQASFRQRYSNMVDALRAAGRPAALCTIYDANYPAPEGEVIRAGLALFNDVITRAAFTHRLPLIDLRLICDDPEDYANPIEPSALGGSKIAAAIARLATAGDLPEDSSTVFAG